MLGYLVRKWREARGSVPGRTPDRSEQPLRSELYSADQMEQHGEILAESHKDTRARGDDRLLPRLAENELVMMQACKLSTQAVEAERRITPAGEWLLDNFYLIEEQIRTVRAPSAQTATAGNCRDWRAAPRPASARLRYRAAKRSPTATAASMRTASIRFVAAYQRVTTLTLGELWAIPIMLRLALIENLRRVAVAHRGRLVRSQPGRVAGRTHDRRLRERTPRT